MILHVANTPQNASSTYIGSRKRVIAVSHLTRRSSPLIHTNNHSMIPLKRLQRQLLLGLNPLIPQLHHLSREHCLRRSSRVDTIGLDRDNNPTSDFQELMRIQTDNARLIRLRDVGEDTVDHAD